MPPSRAAPSSGAAATLPATTATNAPATTAAAGVSATVSDPPLDLGGLEQRLRDTHAIGVFTKLSLKNQVDDLLGQFRSFYRGQSHISLGQLRQKYEVLLMKVVSLLQDDDPRLASAVFSSRESIWGVLADPKKFSNI